MKKLKMPNAYTRWRLNRKIRTAILLFTNSIFLYLILIFHSLIITIIIKNVVLYVLYRKHEALVNIYSIMKLMPANFSHK